LYANASRVLPSFDEARFIESHNHLLPSQLLHHGMTEVVTDSIGVPNGGREQALHPIGTSFSRMLSQVPAIFAGHVTQDPLQKGQGPTMWLWTGKTRGHPSMEEEKLLRPATDIARSDSVSWDGRRFVSLHGLLLVTVTFWMRFL
jgi:hypothetical protein